MVRTIRKCPKCGKPISSICLPCSYGPVDSEFPTRADIEPDLVDLISVKRTGERIEYAAQLRIHDGE